MAVPTRRRVTLVNADARLAIVDVAYDTDQAVCASAELQEAHLDHGLGLAKLGVNSVEAKVEAKVGKE